MTHNRIRPCAACGTPGDYWTAESTLCAECGHCVYCGSTNKCGGGRGHRATEDEARYVRAIIASGFHYVPRRSLAAEPPKA